MTLPLKGWINENAIKDILFQTLVIMPNLPILKPSKSSKDHLRALERRLELWKNLNELLHKAMTIQKNFEKHFIVAGYW